MNKTRKVNVIAAELGDQWQVIVNLPEYKQTEIFYPTNAELVAQGLIREGLAYSPAAVPLVHNIATDLLPEVGRQMLRLAEFARQSQINKRAGEILDEPDCGCVLPEQSCKLCRQAASRLAMCGGEPIPYC